VVKSIDLGRSDVDSFMYFLQELHSDSELRADVQIGLKEVVGWNASKYLLDSYIFKEGKEFTGLIHSILFVN
jgi:hypothetical protein